MDRITRRDALLGGGAISLALLGGAANAEEAPAPESFGAFTLPNSERFVLASKHVGDRFQIDVAWPLKAAEGDRPKLLYVTDGLPNFATLTTMAREGEAGISAPIERLILVAISYPGDDRERTAVLRRRDFTMPGWISRNPGESGGAEKFLRFIEQELDPVIRSHYACAPGKAGMFGASLGGYFAAYALLKRSPLFDRYAISSPGMISEEDPLFALEEACHSASRVLPARVYLTLGALEESGPTPHPDFARCYRKLVARLEQRQYEQLELTTEVLADETHLTAIWLTMSRGLRKLYGLPPRLG